MNFKNFFLIAFSVVTLYACKAQNIVTTSETSRLPEFSWDKMPLYMHLRKNEAFTKEELKYLSNFPLITLEKTTGSKTYGSTELGSIETAKSIKKINPKTKILYYRNVIINWPTYEEDEDFFRKNPNAYLKGADDSFATMRRNNNVKFFDISQESVKNYWLDNAVKYANSPYIDGIFIDANYKVLTPFMKSRKVSLEKREALKASYLEMMQTLKNKIGEKKIIISNILRVRPEIESDNGKAYLKYFDGSYIETFENESFGLTYEDYLAKGIEVVQQSAREGNIIAMTLGLGEALEFENEGIDDRRKNLTADSDFSKRLDYLLAIFLICAEKYSYIYPHDGFNVNKVRKTNEYASKVWLKTFPQYQKPLGKPLAAAKKDGYVYTRSFERVDVVLDIKNKTAQLNWK